MVLDATVGNLKYLMAELEMMMKVFRDVDLARREKLSKETFPTQAVKQSLSYWL